MKLILTKEPKLIAKQYKIILKFSFVLMLYVVCNKIIVGQVVICPENTNIDASLCGTKLPYKLSEVVDSPYNILVDDPFWFTKVYATESNPIIQSNGKISFEREIIIYNDRNLNFIIDASEFIGSCKFKLKCPENFSYCNIEDWTALKALYESTDGDNWKDRTGWDKFIDGHTSPPIICNLGELYGIELLNENINENIATGEIYGFDLHGGYYPIDIDNKGRIVSIFMKSNQLKGNIPAEIGKLNALVSLGLPSNQLSGSIPIDGLINLDNLRYLNLGNLRNLKKFRLVFQSI